MTRLFLFFSHHLTQTQEADAFDSLKVAEVVPLPADLRTLWADIPPEAENIAEHLHPLETWFRATARSGDMALIQGDFGAVFRLVMLALRLDVIPVYATTARQVIETPQPDGTIQVQRTFRHVRFRRYTPIVARDGGKYAL